MKSEIQGIIERIKQFRDDKNAINYPIEKTKGSNKKYNEL